MEDNQQKFEAISKEIREIKKELESKQDKVPKMRRYISWLIMGTMIIAFYAAYYFYINSIFR
jgi:type VI protein secretion system component VasF